MEIPTKRRKSRYGNRVAYSLDSVGGYYRRTSVWLSNRVGVSKEYIDEVIAGERYPSKTVLKKIDRIFGFKVSRY